MNFESWWKDYPRKVGKGAARREWEKAVKLATPEEIHAGLMRNLAWLQGEYRGPAQDFRPHPRTWLHQERWEDDLSPPVTTENMVDLALQAKWEREEHASVEEPDKRIRDRSIARALQAQVGQARKPH